MVTVVAAAINRTRSDRIEPTECCHPACHDDPFPDAPVPLCSRHIAQVIRDYQDRIMTRPDLVARSRIEAVEAAPRAWGRPVVYFIRLGDRVRIGFSANVRQRLAALPYETILRVIPGTPSDERAWHAPAGSGGAASWPPAA